jgi:type II secretory pathway pseudopilin PulG
MDYNNQFENNNTPNRFNEPRERGGGVKSILIGILSALVVLGLVGGGIWLYNSGKGTSTGSSSSSNSTTSTANSSKSTTQVSSTTSTVVSSTNSSVSSLAVSSSITSTSSQGRTEGNVLLTYSDSKIPGITFNYDRVSTNVETVVPTLGAGSYINITRPGTNQKLFIEYGDYSGAGNGRATDCYDKDNTQDIGNGWLRVVPEFKETGKITRLFINPTIGGQNLCIGGTNVPRADPDTSVKKGTKIFVIRYDVPTFEERGAFDELVKTITIQ